MTLERSGENRNFRVERLIGRESERRSLNAALDRALRFEAPQFVTLIGSAGIGKSRLLAEWLKDVGERRNFRSVFVSAAGDSVIAEPGGILGHLLRARIGITAAMDKDATLAVFREELQAVFGDRRVSEMAGLLGAFIGLTPVGSPLVQSLAMRPEQQAELSRAVLCRFLEEDVASVPCCMPSTTPTSRMTIH